MDTGFFTRLADPWILHCGRTFSAPSTRCSFRRCRPARRRGRAVRLFRHRDTGPPPKRAKASKASSRDAGIDLHGSAGIVLSGCRRSATSSAYSTVTVKARVDGQIVEVGFSKARKSPRGRVLFKIDPRPYERHCCQPRHFLRDPRKRTMPARRSGRYRNCSPEFRLQGSLPQIRTNADTAKPWPWDPRRRSTTHAEIW